MLLFISLMQVPMHTSSFCRVMDCQFNHIQPQ